MAYQLRERAPRSLEDMKSIAISVEANLISKQARARAKRRMPIKEEPSTFEQKLDAIIKGMDRLGDIVETIERKSPWDGQPNNTRRNPNLKKIRILILERLALTKTLDLHSKKTMLKLQLLVNQQKTPKLT